MEEYKFVYLSDSSNGNAREGRNVNPSCPIRALEFVDLLLDKGPVNNKITILPDDSLISSSWLED